MPNSLPAFSATFSTSAMALTMPISTSLCSVSSPLSSGKVTPTLVASSSQWRSRMPALRRETMIGTRGRKRSSSSRTWAAMTLHWERLLRSKVLADLFRLRSRVFTLFSTTSASRAMKEPFVQVSLLDSHFSQESHRSKKGSKVLASSDSSPYSVGLALNRLSRELNSFDFSSACARASLMRRTVSAFFAASPSFVRSLSLATSDCRLDRSELNSCCSSSMPLLKLNSCTRMFFSCLAISPSSLQGQWYTSQRTSISSRGICHFASSISAKCVSFLAILSPSWSMRLGSVDRKSLMSVSFSILSGGTATPSNISLNSTCTVSA
mmetsp:Transcript_2068/g.4847  ORF Transcript_2068/g.4847 Transcript_2068/m.4847 type:complete len:323 (+) Transcript_2068:688-1656(+)